MADLAPGESAVLADRTGGPPSAPPDSLRELEELGFLPGEPVTVIARASWGGPLAVRVRGAVFALRREEAARLAVGRES